MQISTNKIQYIYIKKKNNRFVETKIVNYLKLKKKGLKKDRFDWYNIVYLLSNHIHIEKLAS